MSKRKLKENNRPKLVAVIQGGISRELRKRCLNGLEEISNSEFLGEKIPFAGYGFGARPVDEQGNFLFDYSENEYWKTGILIKVIIDSELRIEYIPIVKRGNCVRLATEKDIKDILNAFKQRSQEILQKGFIEKEYKNFAQDNIQSYLRKLSGVGKWMSRIDRKILNGLILKRKYNEKKLLAIQNYIECEAHKELVLTGLKGVIVNGRK